MAVILSSTNDRMCIGLREVQYFTFLIYKRDFLFFRIRYTIHVCSRSHCIFTIYISSREPGSATIRKAKLHLVDLAGSERVHKTGVNGTLLTEAKYINLSLHFLEQVSNIILNITRILYLIEEFGANLMSCRGSECLS